MSVVFSTYHSIQAVSEAQLLHGMPDFDLIVCDEAHRTTGATFADDEKASNFVKIHDAEYIRSAKRMQMTATPRIYGDGAKAQAEKDATVICSMDDEALYGKQLHVITFSEAVDLKLLTDYKVLVLTVSQDHVSQRLQKLLADDDNSLKVDDAARIIGCWKALSKQGENGEFGDDTVPMRRAVAFCQVIERQTGTAKTHKVSSKEIAGMFSKVVSAYQEQDDSDNDLLCEAAHVDGSMNVGQKEEKLDWLKAEANTCRILSNVRCLSEGVDVSALDAVLFLTPRNSQVDVVQSVGRVMRNAPGKERGYVVLPVVIPHGMEAHEALNDNKVYKVVWDVLQALRSHDDKFDAFVNKLKFDGKNSRKMELINIDGKKMEIVAKVEKINKKSKSTPGEKSTSGQGKHGIGETQKPGSAQQTDLKFEVGDLERALYAKIVKKCGSRNYWDDWAKDIAEIANTHISRITAIVTDEKNVKEVAVFTAFANELRDDLNDFITDSEVIEMLAQHLITKPVFDSLFAEYSFASHNPVSKAMQEVLDILNEHRLSKEVDTLEKFYASVARKAKDTNTAEGKQKIVVELYDKFFRNAFPRMTERLGIVYTPVEVVDFIIHSVNDLLKQEFGQTLGSEGVHIIDPFTGTGTFITRLLQSGLITKEQLPHKYRHEIHANEIVLLAYYIAAINIEAVYHGIMRAPENVSPLQGSDSLGDGTQGAALGYGIKPFQGEENTSASTPLDHNEPSAPALASNSSAPMGQNPSAQGIALGSTPPTISSPVGAQYEPFQGICLTDTFRLEEKDLISDLLANNSERRKRLQKLDVRVIMENPPYSAGQDSANDNNQNVVYPELDERIRETYAAHSTATNKNALYDSYIRAIRWASDRIGKSGIIGFVTNAGFLEANTADGMRKCLAEEFSSIYVFHLRGNQRTSGELSRKEGGKVFGSGSRAPIAVTLLVKNPDSDEHGKIRWHDIGDYLTQAEKLAITQEFLSVRGVSKKNGWVGIVPDSHNDWVGQRDESFSDFIDLGDKKSEQPFSISKSYSNGIKTNRDAWCYNLSLARVSANMTRMIGTYNSEVERIKAELIQGVLPSKFNLDSFIETNPTLISWNRGLKNDLSKGKILPFKPDRIFPCLYRPFTRVWSYFDKD